MSNLGGKVKLWYNIFMQDIREQVKTAIKKVFDIDLEPEVAPAPENIGADYSSNAPLKLAGVLHKAPMEIAKELEAVLEGASVSNPGFLNFNLPDDYLEKEIDVLADGFDEKVSSNNYNNQTVICEFSDPNPFKVLHVGHLYTSIMGDAISRLYENAGARVIRANFGGDVGLHVAKTMYILMQKDPETLTIDDIGKCYVEGTAAYEDDEDAHAKITELNKEIYKINAEDIHGTALADLYWKGRELSYQYFNDFYASIGVKFDKYYPESTVAGLGLEIVKRELENGVYEKSNGAVIFDGDKYGLHTRVFINQEGVPTYEAKDVGLIFQKDADYHFDKSVVITGSEQLEYMKVVLASISKYAPELVEKTTHLTHGMVRLPGNAKMSSRLGNFLKAVDVLEAVDKALESEYNSKDTKVALGATKYALLKYKIGGNIVFDPEESVSMTGNSGPYLQYSAVRAAKIIGNLLQNGVTNASGKWELTERERELIKKIVAYPEELKSVIRELAPNKLCNYLYELAQEFSRFYETTKVAGSDFEFERGQIVLAYLKVLTHGLLLLGIEVPERM